jgi:transglutaminase-like putative cysteine protease
VEFSNSECKGESTDIKRAVKLYYAVRDKIFYNPYRISFDPSAMKASSVLEKKRGYCVTKAVLLAAVARALGIPSRLGFADVQNHLASERLKKIMESDVFVYHGYTELYLNHKWVKATPAFNLSLCKRFGVNPLEFDGKNDSIFQAYDSSGQYHLKYVKDHGIFDDLPHDRIVEGMKKHHPLVFEKKNENNK